MNQIGYLKLDASACALGFFQSSSKTRIWIAFYNGELQILTGDLYETQSLNFDFKSLNDLCYCPTNHLFMAVGDAGIRIYEPEFNEIFNPFPFWTPDLYKVCPSRDDEIISGGSDEVLWRANFPNGTTEKLTDMGEELHSISVHPHDNSVLYVTGSHGFYTAILNIPSKPEAQIISRLEMQKATAHFDSTGDFILQFDQQIRCFSYPSLDALWAFSLAEGFTAPRTENDWKSSSLWSNPCFITNGLVVGSSTGEILVIDTAQRKLRLREKLVDSAIEHIAYDASTHVLLVLDKSNELNSWVLAW